ncbi:MAG TPA: 2-amino-4-hydroxy-6-hydroxymethyldihydropteridine diphosphokinase [Burkholderiaceae bacterium]|nr:2-amino-4-hydroxy-6-hydroxymethyldihydropteridine diphosphokinase [Burkholderiaceae bacterium]
MDAWIGLGANLGDRRAAIGSALDALRLLPRTRLLARSRLWASPPLDADGPDYLNAVARLDTGLAADELLAALHAIEARAGRERPHRNAPRTLDLDLLLHGDATIDGPSLTLPHPRIAARAFVLRPLAELDPDLLVPGRGRVRELLPAVAAQRCVPWSAR